MTCDFARTEYLSTTADSANHTTIHYTVTTLVYLIDYANQLPVQANIQYTYQPVKYRYYKKPQSRQLDFSVNPICCPQMAETAHLHIYLLISM